VGTQVHSTGYEGPRITDYGDLVRLTSVVHPPPFAGAAQDLSFSSPHSTTGGDTGAVLPASAVSPISSSGSETPDAAGAVQGAGASGGGTGAAAGGHLPFTGFVPGLVAATGAGFAAVGVFIRRVLRLAAK
jgi:hypothetical protein